MTDEEFKELKEEVKSIDRFIGAEELFTRLDEANVWKDWKTAWKIFNEYKEGVKNGK